MVSASKKTRKSAKAAGTQFKILLSGYGGHGLTAFTLHAPAGVHIRFFDRQRGGVRKTRLETPSAHNPTARDISHARQGDSLDDDRNVSCQCIPYLAQVPRAITQRCHA